MDKLRKISHPLWQLPAAAIGWLFRCREIRWSQPQMRADPPRKAESDGVTAILQLHRLNTTQLLDMYLLPRNFVTTVTAGLGIYLGN